MKMIYIPHSNAAAKRSVAVNCNAGWRKKTQVLGHARSDAIASLTKG
jgi:hypothetical protein